MEKNVKNIDNLFKEELGSYTEAPPPPVWDALEKRLNEKRKRRPFPYGWMWYIGVVAFVALLGASVLWKMGSLNTIAKTGTPNGDASPKQQNVVAGTTVSGKKSTTNNSVAIVAHKKHHSNKVSATNSDHETKNTTSHYTPHKKANNEQIATTKNNSNKTNDDLYADVDDDQYTVGYSSNSRRNNGPLAESDEATDYSLQQRSQNNMVVAEMQPAQHVREVNYGSVAGDNSMSKNLPASSQSQYLKTENTSVANDKHLLAYNSEHKHRTVAHNPVSKNAVQQPTVNDNGAPIVSKQRKHRVQNTNAAQVNVVAAAPPIVKTNKVPLPAAIAEVATHEKGREAKKYIHHNLHHKNSSAPDGSIAAATPVIKTHKVATLADAANTSNKKVYKATTNTSTRQSKKSTSSESGVASMAPVAKNNTAIGNNSAIASVGEHKKANVKNTGSKSYVTKATAIMPGTDKNIATSAKASNREQSSADINKQPQAIVNATTGNTASTSVDEGDKKAVASNKKKEANTLTVLKDKPIATTANTNNTTKTVRNTNKTHRQRNTTANDNQPVKPVVNGSMASKKLKPVTKHNVAIKQAGEQTSATANANKKAIVPVAADNNNRASNKVADTKTISGNEPTLIKKEHAGKTQKNAAVISVDKTVPIEQKAVAKNENKPGKKQTNRKTNNSTGKTASATPTVIAPPPANAFSSSFSKRTVEDETVAIDNLKVDNFTGQQPLVSNNGGEVLPGTFKQNDAQRAKPDSIVSATPMDTATKHNFFSRHFEAGIKGGYEAGFSKDAGNKFVVSPYIQYNLSDKFAVMTQPSVKVSRLNDHINIGTGKSYVKTLGDTITPGGSGVVVIPILSGNTIEYVTEELREYNYTQIYDTVVKSNSLGHKYTEFEMPLLLKYKIGKQLSVYGGLNLVYGKMISIAENTYTSGPLLKSGIGATMAAMGANAPTPPPVNTVIHYNDSLLSTYRNPYPSPQGDILRLGYMLGFSYEYKKRWLFDALIQQATAKPNNVDGVNTNTTLSLPYFRFTIGYKLTK